MANTVLEFEYFGGVLSQMSVDLTQPDDASVVTGLSSGGGTLSEETNGSGSFQAIHAGSQTGHLRLHLKVNGTTVQTFHFYVAADDTSTYYSQPAAVAAAGGYGNLSANNTGPGGSSVTMTIQDGGASPIAGASVWSSSDSAGSTVIAGTLVTDSSGQATFLLSAGSTYYMWVQKPSYNSIVGESFVASAAGHTFTMTAASTSPTTSAGADSRRITVVEETRLRQLEQSAPQSGTPKYAAIRPKKGTGQQSQRWELLLYPTPNGTETLSYRYSAEPPPLSDDFPFPLGGKAYAETLLQSCLAVAEERETKQRGPASDRFMERLAASIQLDVQSARPTDDEGMWPIENPPDDLTIDLDYLKRLVGRAMGYGAQPGAWSHKELNLVSEAIRSGLRRFYTPPVLQGREYAHEWSFLRPLDSLTTVSGTYEYDLPADLAMIDGPLTYEGDNVLYYEVEHMDEHKAGRRYNRQFNSRPRFFSTRVNPQADGATRYKLILWPTPDDAYTLNYRYKTNPGLLSVGIAEPAGGMPHSQTVLESCLLSADELVGKDTRVRYARYMECLKASVSHDQQANAADNLGRNYDRSDSYDGSAWGVNWRRFYDGSASVTYGGVQY